LKVEVNMLKLTLCLSPFFTKCFSSEFNSIEYKGTAQKCEIVVYICTCS